MSLLAEKRRSRIDVSCNMTFSCGGVRRYGKVEVPLIMAADYQGLVRYRKAPPIDRYR